MTPVAHRNHIATAYTVNITSSSMHSHRQGRENAGHEIVTCFSSIAIIVIIINIVLQLPPKKYT